MLRPLVRAGSMYARLYAYAYARELHARCILTLRRRALARVEDEHCHFSTARVLMHGRAHRHLMRASSAMMLPSLALCSRAHCRRHCLLVSFAVRSATVHRAGAREAASRVLIAVARAPALRMCVLHASLCELQRASRTHLPHARRRTLAQHAARYNAAVSCSASRC